MLTIFLAVASWLILLAELWLGIAVTGWQGDDLYVERSKSPAIYWCVMAFHAIVSIGLPTLSFHAGI